MGVLVKETFQKQRGRLGRFPAEYLVKCVGTELFLAYSQEKPGVVREIVRIVRISIYCPFVQLLGPVVILADLREEVRVVAEKKNVILELRDAKCTGVCGRMLQVLFASRANPLVAPYLFTQACWRAH